MRERPPSVRTQRLAIAMLAASLGVIATATLTPGGPTVTESGFSCLICGERGMADAVLNVALFVPLGVSLALLGARVTRAVAYGALLTLAIETIQLVLPGRDASPGDVLANTLGVVVGIAVVAAAPKWLEPRAAAAGRLSLATGVLATCTFLATGYLLEPSFPRTAYYGQWTPNPGHLARYDAEVLEVTLGALELPSRRLDNSEVVRDALLRGEPLEIRALAGQRTDRLGALFSIADEFQERIVLIGPDRDELVYRYRARAADWRLDHPDLRMKSVAATAPQGDSIRVVTWLRPDGRCLTDGAATRCGLGFTVGQGWSLLYYPEHLPHALRYGLRVLWVGLWLLPLGVWGRRRPETAGALALITLTLAAPTLQGGLLPTPPSEWIGAALGLATGRVFRRLASRRRDAPGGLGGRDHPSGGGAAAGGAERGS